ncbi:MAG: hypothetical protein KatS3mg103_0512 [Phycisphaerales bacterium]|nr:MAG: hypothetical protein KatS3mg103_0512 [Phycisphaerales bacterium]
MSEARRAATGPMGLRWAHPRRTAGGLIAAGLVAWGAMGLLPVAGLLGVCALVPGCATGQGGIRRFPPPPEDVMPRRVLVVKRGETDLDLDGYIDGVLVEVYLFNNDRQDEGADQPFHRRGELRFRLVGPQAETFCEGTFDAQAMADAQITGLLGPGYGLQIHFGARGYEDLRDRVAARMDVEFVPTSKPDSRAFGSTQIRLGPVF